MYYCYGQIRSRLATPFTPAATYRTNIIFTAGENPVEIRAIAYWGGDANEFYTIALAPPGWVNGTLTSEGNNPEKWANGIIPITGGVKGGLFTNVKKGNAFIPVTLTDSIISPIIVPPNYNLVLYPTTNTMSVALQTAVLGQDLVKP